MWNEIMTLFRNYSGNGFAIALFVLSFFYLLFTEKDRTRRIILLYLSAITLTFFFCPLYAKAVYSYLDGETYYRILWLVPMTAVIAYAGVCLTERWTKKWKRGLAFVAACGLIIGTGDYVYDNPYFMPAENRFHVPQTVALVCDAIIVEGREVKAVFPSEMLSYVRQYTANVCMPYGREMVVERWGHENPLYDAMEAEEIDCKEVAVLALEQGCHYIIVHETKPLRGDFKKLGYGYHYVETVAGYRIYFQDGIELTV